MYCLSNLSGLIYDGCSGELGFLGMVDGYILSWREKLAKPDPQIYHLLLDRYSLRAEECIYIDDSKINVLAAVNLGMTGIVFQDQKQAEHEIQRIRSESI